MVAHRIGMIPINVTDIVNFRPEDYEFVLDVKNTGKTVIDVRAGDIKVYKKDPENPLEMPLELPNAQYFPPDPITGETLLITRLRPQWNPGAPQEQLTIKARASISTGTENIRWSPVAQASYEYTKDSDQEHITATFNNWLLQKKKITDPSTLAQDVSDTLMREFMTMEVQRCFLKDTKGEANDFTFHMESIGIQPIPQIVSAGLAACTGIVTNYIDMDTTLPANVRVIQADARYPAIDVIFQNESHTLGNLLETYLADNHVDGVAEPRITYVGYKVPHPLKPEMFVRIGLSADEDVEGQKNRARNAIATAARALKEQFRGLQSEWETFTANLPQQA